VGKVCSTCREWRKDEDFHANGDSLRSQCRECRATHARISKYTLPDTWIQDTFEEQDGLCAICGGQDPFLVIDHDHSCCPGTQSCGLCVRAMICRDCNFGLGFFHDDPDRLTRAVEYLDQHKPWEG
jgi:hypothetical protein